MKPQWCKANKKPFHFERVILSFWKGFEKTVILPHRDIEHIGIHIEMPFFYVPYVIMWFYLKVWQVIVVFIHKCFLPFFKNISNIKIDDDTFWNF